MNPGNRMTISESFQELIRRIQPLDTEPRAACQHLATIRTRLETEFDVSKCVTIGSFARDTSIKVHRDLIYAGQRLRIEVLHHVILGMRTPERPQDYVPLRELGYCT